jgi:hypothetical protein
MVSFDTNVLVYATASISDVNMMRARDLIARAMRATSRVRSEGPQHVTVHGRPPSHCVGHLEN